MILITQYFQGTSLTRNSEINACLERNLANPHIEKIYLLNEKKYPSLTDPKIEQVIIGKRLTHKDAVELANRDCEGDICIVANADIYFDDTLNQIQSEELDETCMCLSRWELEDGDSLHPWNPTGMPWHFEGSQDSWIFMSPLKVEFPESESEQKVESADVLNFFDKVYVINLDKRTDRWEECQKELQKVGLTDRAVRVSGVEIPDDPKKGCSLANKRVLEQAIKDKAENALILEDDFIFEIGFAEELAKSIIDLKEQQSWDVFYLGYRFVQIGHEYRGVKGKDCGPIPVSPSLLKIRGALSTHAYAVNGHFLKQLSEYITGEDVKAPDEYYWEVATRHNFFGTNPCIAYQKEGVSDIEGENIDWNTVDCMTTNWAFSADAKYDPKMKLGTPWCDQLFAIFLKEQKIELINPCNNVISVHVHGDRNRMKKKYDVDVKPNAAIEPSPLKCFEVKKTAVVTVAIGDRYNAMGRIAHPTMKAYADKIGAQFIVIDEEPEGMIPHFAKFAIRDLLDEFDRIIYIDTDIVVRPDCPNLFEEIPQDQFGIFKEGEFIPERMQHLEMAAKTYHMPLRMNPKDWKGTYYNTGVMVMSKMHKYLWQFPAVIDPKGGGDLGEQGWINIMLINTTTPVKKLNYRFNRMTALDKFTGEPRQGSYLIHYAGCPFDDETLLKIMKDDIQAWKDNPEYSFPRVVVLDVGGGMGDQIDAEPVARYVLDYAYPDAEVHLLTDWPRIFEHLKDRLNVVKRTTNALNLGDRPHYMMRTLPSPDTPLWSFMSQALTHPTDFSSVSCLRTTLTAQQKQIKIKIGLEDIAKASRLVDCNVGDIVIVHCGRGWPSKTFPVEWWQAVADGIHENGFNVALIGKHISKEQGLVEIECRDGMIDLRNKTDVGDLFTLISQARVTVTNDSCPLHIAGAFDKWIVLMPSCKHPEHLAPFRNGSQTWKQKWLYKKLTCDAIDSTPTMVHGQTIDWVEGDILDYIPDPETVVKEVIECYRSDEG